MTAQPQTPRNGPMRKIGWELFTVSGGKKRDKRQTGVKRAILR
jgi:hypothetical protein